VNGFLVPQRDIEKLANRLTLLISNAELRNKLGEAGKEKYLKNYTVEIFAQRFNSIMHQIIE